MLSDERREVSDGKLRTLGLKSPRSCQEKTPEPLVRFIFRRVVMLLASEVRDQLRTLFPHML